MSQVQCFIFTVSQVDLNKSVICEHKYEMEIQQKYIVCYTKMYKTYNQWFLLQVYCTNA